MCYLKRQQISLRTRHRNSRRTWIANLLYRFTGGKLILEGWHRASDISSSAEGLNKKDLFLHHPPVFEQPRFSSFTVTCAHGTKSFSSFISFSFMSHPSVYTYIFFSFSSPPPSLENAFRNKSGQFGRNRFAFEERTRYRISYYSTGILLLSIFPPILACIRTYIDTYMYMCV